MSHPDEDPSANHSSASDPAEDSAASDLPASDSIDLEAHRKYLKRNIESLLFAADKPLTIKRLRQLVREPNAGLLKEVLGDLCEEYSERGIVLDAVAGGYQFRTHPETSEVVQKLASGRPVRLTRAQLEALAIIAYRQPITRPEIDDIRGVDSGGTLKILLDRNLVRVLGKKEEPGRPLVYGTTKDFLEFFNLNQLGDLPTLREYHELTEDSLREVERLEKEQAPATAAPAEAAIPPPDPPPSTDPPPPPDQDEPVAE